MHIALEWYQIIDTAIDFEDEHAICIKGQQNNPR